MHVCTSSSVDYFPPLCTVNLRDTWCGLGCSYRMHHYTYIYIVLFLSFPYYPQQTCSSFSTPYLSLTMKTTTQLSRPESHPQSADQIRIVAGQVVACTSSVQIGYTESSATMQQRWLQLHLSTVRSWTPYPTSCSVLALG